MTVAAVAAVRRDYCYNIASVCLTKLKLHYTTKLANLRMQAFPSTDADAEPQPPPYIDALLRRAGLQLQHAAGKRFGVFAAKSFAAGSLILTEEAAACCVSRGGMQSSRSRGQQLAATAASIACSHCMCDDKPLLKCTACGIAHYCCKEHQAAHWPRHKPMCARHKKLAQQQQQQQQQHAATQQHSSIVSLCAELFDSTRSQTTGSSRPSHADVMFMCTARATDAASEVAAAVRGLMGDDGAACACWCEGGGCVGLVCGRACVCGFACTCLCACLCVSVSVCDTWARACVWIVCVSASRPSH